MLKKTPILDKRSNEDIFYELINKMKEHFPNWDISIDNNPGVLIQFIYARLMGIAIEQLNKVPEKSFLVFLDTMGLSQMPVSPARVPLTFVLKKNVSPTIVPKGTKVSSVDATGKEACIYETITDLTVLPISIMRLMTIDCIWKRYTEIILGAENKNRLFKPFIGEKRMEHSVKFSNLRLTNGFNGIKFCLCWQKGSGLDYFEKLRKYKWFADEGKVQSKYFEPRKNKEIPMNLVNNNRDDIGDYIGIRLEPAKNGDSGYIDSIKALCYEDCGRKESSGDYSNMKAKIESTSERMIGIEHMLYNQMELDQTSSFTPFGKIPKKDGCLYFSCDEVFSKIGENDSLYFTLSIEGKEYNRDCTTIRYLLKNITEKNRPWGRGKYEINLSLLSIQNDKIDIPFYRDRSSELEDISFREVNGITYIVVQFEMMKYPGNIAINTAGIKATVKSMTENIVHETGLLWFQSATSIDEYKTIDSFIEGNNRESILGEGKFIYLAAEIPERIAGQGTLTLNFCPGEISWEYYSDDGWIETEVKDETKALTQTGNIDFEFINKKQLNYTHNGISGKWIRGRLKSPAAIYSVLNTAYISRYKALIKPDVIPEYEAPIKPNVNFDNRNNSGFYIAFDKIYPEQPMSLYIITERKKYNDSAVASKIRNELHRDISWEYFDGSKWIKLPVTDSTSGLTETGSLKFLTPKNMRIIPDMTDTPGCYWIRATKENTNPLSEVEISGIFLNTVDSIQTETYKNEVLGSGNGKANQKFKTGHKPIIYGERVYIKELVKPQENELKLLGYSNEDNPILIETNSVNSEEEIWVRWREKANFISSDTKSRDYIINRTTGEISFGDGLQGMVVPRIPNNVRITYSVTQGENGNVDALSVNKLVSQMPEIDKVSNMVRANGGTPGESIDGLKIRGPQHLRNQLRALSYEDYEWLVVEAGDGQVARIKCLPCVNNVFSFERGWVTILVVPNGIGKVLTPDNILLKKIFERMKDKVFHGLNENESPKLNISGPGYIKVDMAVAVSPQNIDNAQQVKENVLDALSKFLHPLHGGQDTKGWQFGRSVYASEVCQIVENIPGVDHMIYEQLKIKPNSYQAEFTLVDPGHNLEIQKGSLMVSQDGKKSAIVVRRTIINGYSSTIAVRGFKEGDEITFSQEIVCNIEKDINENEETNLKLKNFNSSIDFPEGSMLVLDKYILKTICNLSSINWNPKTIAKINDGKISGKNEANCTLLYPFPMTVTDVDCATKGKVFLRIKPYFIEIPDSITGTVSTIDNRVKLPIERVVREGEAITGLWLADFINDYITINENEGLKINSVSNIEDVAYISDNYLVYPGDISIDVTSQV